MIDCPNHNVVVLQPDFRCTEASVRQEVVTAAWQTLETPKSSEFHRRRAYAVLVKIYARSDCGDDAWRVCQAGLRCYPGDPELLFCKGFLHQHFGRADKARRCYVAVLNHRHPCDVVNVDRGVRRLKARQNLALAYEAVGKFVDAEEQWRAIITEEPLYRIGWRGLGEVLLQRGNLDAVDRLTQLLREKPFDTLRAEAFFLQGRACENRGELEQAERLYQDAVARWPDDLDAYRALYRFLLEHDGLNIASDAVHELVCRHYGDAATCHAFVSQPPLSIVPVL